MKKLSVLFLFLIIINFLYSQETIYYDKVYQDSIKTVQLKVVGSLLSYPVINLGSNDKLILTFDDLNGDNQVFDYYYTFIHCNADWTQSNLFFNDFCDGFDDNQIYNYTNSFNTQKDYVHYEQSFPNNDINFLKSGNYIVKVYKDGNPDDVVLTKRFCINENLASINANIYYSKIAKFRQSYHELDFTVSSHLFNSINPLRDVSVYVYQNNNQFNFKNLHARFIKNNDLFFDDSYQNNFLAGNEFRFFTIKNIRSTSEKIRKIELLDDYYYFELYAEKEKSNYYFQEDIDGRYVIQNELGRDSDIDAEYAYVFFKMPRSNPFIQGDVYIFGELSNWQYDDKYKMNYNVSNNCYEATLFLKQGYYNFAYMLKDNENIEPIDGNYVETKNNYCIYTYIRDYGLNYDKLIGYKIIKN